MGSADGSGRVFVGIWVRLFRRIGDEGGTDGFAPGIGAEGVDVFVLRGLDGIEHGLAEVGQGGGGFALDAALRHAGEDMAESGTEIAGGEVTAGEPRGNIAADGLGGLGLCFLTGMKAARRGWPEKRGVRHLRPSAKVKEHKDAQSLERRVDMDVSRK